MDWALVVVFSSAKSPEIKWLHTTETTKKQHTRNTTHQKRKIHTTIALMQYMNRKEKAILDKNRKMKIQKKKNRSGEELQKKKKKKKQHTQNIAGIKREREREQKCATENYTPFNYSWMVTIFSHEWNHCIF